MVDVLHDGSEALVAVGNTPFDVVVLDVMLPGRDGLSVVRLMRQRRIAIPVLLLTARGEVSEKVEGLNAGADDYLPKPFALEELLARVRALGPPLQRHQITPPSHWRPHPRHGDSQSKTGRDAD